MKMYKKESNYTEMDYVNVRGFDFEIHMLKSSRYGVKEALHGGCILYLELLDQYGECHGIFDHGVWPYGAPDDWSSDEARLAYYYFMAKHERMISKQETRNRYVREHVCA